MTPGLLHYLTLASILFSLGFYTTITRKNAISILMGIELMLNAANINFIAFSRFTNVSDQLIGQVFPIFSIMVAAAEAAVGLAIVLSVFNNWKSIDTQDIKSLQK